ncbi:peptidoglycan-binding protein [Streptomyces sp. HNM0574]|uniref:peptidoglycan-binding protein n=1 Tax=Streptomyces sp. HNM0574 TaxID=2714954 RepID=UPI00146F56A6|nr:peptidoglycan-binding protein [Streptomyces sp. HNM0574]NLU68219.1 N-acetylmuramoyl-L-alanine amidase [Streptomyces sp. HNM0574]
MAKPLSADRMVKALKDEGLTVHEHRNWRRHHRNAKGAWGPLNGVMIHHTVTSGTESSVELCYNGRSGLPGPLCHGVIDKQGEVWLVGNGRANHAGLGDGDVLDAVVGERNLPADNQADTDGNARFYGFECINLGDGEDPWPKAQMEAIVRVSAAICRAHEWNERSVIGHKEWQPGKTDPRGFTMDSLRGRIKDRLGKKPGDGGGVGGGDGDGGGGKPAPELEPFPGADFFHDRPDSPVITRMGKRLVSEGCSHYEIGPGPQWTEADRQSYAAWQRKLGYSGQDADGIPGPESWKRLRVPKG